MGEYRWSPSVIAAAPFLVLARFAGTIDGGGAAFLGGGGGPLIAIAGVKPSQSLPPSHKASTFKDGSRIHEDSRYDSF